MVTLNGGDVERAHPGNGRDRVITILASLVAGVLPASGLYFTGSRPNADVERRVDRIESEQNSRTNRFAIIEALADNNRRRIEILETRIERLLSGGK